MKMMTIKHKCGHDVVLTLESAKHAEAQKRVVCRDCAAKANAIKEQEKAEALQRVLSGAIKIVVRFDPNTADSWGSYEVSICAEWNSPEFRAYSHFSSENGKYEVPKEDWEKGKDITKQWCEWANVKIQREAKREKAENERRAKALASAKETGTDQLLRSMGGSVNDGSGGECFGTVGVFIRADGTTYRKVTERAY